MEWEEKIKTWYDRYVRTMKFGRDTSVFLIFLLISTLFWLLNQLSKETTAEVSYPVRFYNSGEKRIIINDLPASLRLEVKGQGYKLMKYKMKPWKIPLDIDLRTFPLRPAGAGDTRRFYLLSSYMKGFVNDRLGGKMVLQRIHPDTLWFVFDSLVVRRIPVVADVVLEPARQYIFKKPPHLTPDTVTVTGPAMILDTLRRVKTRHAEFRNVEKSFVRDISLVHPPRVTFSVDQVTLQVDVEQYTEVVYKIPVMVKHAPDTVNLRLFPPEVKVSFRVGLSRYNKLIPGMFSASVDYHDLAKNRSGKLTIRLDKQPAGIGMVRLDPERVEYLIERKP